MFIDLAYSMANGELPDFDSELHDLLGIPDHSGYGFGLRDMQWHDLQSVHTPEQIAEDIHSLISSFLAYLTISTDDEGQSPPVVQYEAHWFQVNPVDPVPPTQGH